VSVLHLSRAPAGREHDVVHAPEHNPQQPHDRHGRTGQSRRIQEADTLSRRGRRWLPAGLAAGAAALGLVAFLMFADQPLKAARRRVPLGADEATVVRAVGRAPDSALGKPGGTPEDPPRALFWQFGDEPLFVLFDADGRAVKADRYSWYTPPTPWERVRAWLGL
jgi:hypothetical protein